MAVWGLCALLTITAADERVESLLLNGALASPRGWNLYHAQLVDRAGGGRCLRVTGGGSASQDVDLDRPGTFSAAVDLRVSSVQPVGGPGYAYAAVYELDARGEIVAYRDFVQLTGDRDWQRHSVTFQTHPQARTLSVRCGVFQATGTAEFANWTLVAGATPRRLDEVANVGLLRQGQPRAAVLNEPGLPVRGAPSQPRVIRAILEQAGFAVDDLTADQLADPTTLRPDRYELVVLPAGEAFPAAARRTWLAYLHRGGSFVSLGGYAFNHLVARSGQGWVTERERVAEALVAATAAERSLLADGGFEREAPVPVGGESLDATWHRSHESAEVVTDGAAVGRRCGRVSVPAGATIDERKFMLDLTARPWRYRVSAQVRTQDVVGPGFAYVALYQYDRDGKLVKHRDFITRTGTTAWSTGSFDFVPEQGVTRLHVKLGLYRASGTAWFDDVRLCDISGLAEEPLNTATGLPRDGLQTLPTQIGVFDPSVPLKRVARVASAARWPQVTLQGHVRGWVATGVQGQNHARWVPVLETFDRYGRPRGAAAALLLHYGGYFAGSRWAYFGVDNRDLFTAAGSPAARLLGEVCRTVARAPFLHSLTCDQALYRPGETVPVTCSVEAAEALPAGAGVRFTAGPDGGPTTAGATVALAGSEAQTVTWQVRVPEGATGRQQIRAALVRGDQELDVLTTAFETPAPPPATATPELAFEGNVFRLGGRPQFIFGTDDYSLAYHSPYRGVATWEAELRAARDIGLDLYENLQYSNPGHQMQDLDWRRFDALARLTQQRGLIFMPGLLIGHDVVCDDAELARQSAQCQAYAERLGQTPGLLWYINGDYQLRPERDQVVTKQLWERWLRQRYPTPERLRAAWPGAESAPWPVPDSGRWDDRAQVDRVEFTNDLMRRWNAAHVAAIRSADARHPITSEYYSTPFGGMDLRLTIDGQNVSNIGYFDQPQQDLDRLPLRLAWNDLRLRGKGVSLGEYGVKTHPAWTAENGATGYHLVRTEEEQQQLHLTVAAYTLGLGGCKIQNWCLKDSEQSVFPWGLFYPQELVAKDAAITHRNASLLFRGLAPADEPCPLAVCLPSRSRIGARDHLGVTAGYHAFDALLGLHADFRVMDDHEAGDLRPELTAIVLPAAFAVADADFDRLVAWVRNGGQLLVTGDPSYDAGRQPAPSNRLLTLCGVRRENALGLPGERGPEPVTVDLGAPVGRAALRPTVRVAAAGAEVLATSEAGPVLTRHRLGQGQVTWLSDPLELSNDAADQDLLRAIYARFLAAAAVPVQEVTPNQPWLHALARPTTAGRVHVLFPRQELGEATLTTRAGRVSLGLRGRWPALAHVGADRAVRMAIARGRATVDGREIFSGRGLLGLAALDGRDLRSSSQVLVTPFETGEVRLPARAGRWEALVGDLDGGSFRVLERLPLAGDSLRVPIDEDRQGCLIVVKPVDTGAAVEALNRLASRPWTVPGR